MVLYSFSPSQWITINHWQEKATNDVDAGGDAAFATGDDEDDKRRIANYMWKVSIKKDVQQELVL